MIKIPRIEVMLGLLIGLSSCESFLDPKRDQSLVVPNTLTDVRNLLDNTSIFTRQPVMQILASDDFMASDAGFASMNQFEQQVYSWSREAYPSNALDEWANGYRKVFYANVALDALISLDSETDEHRELRGEALFQRSHAYYHLLQQFAPAYQKDGGNELLSGIVLKDSPDINEKAVRSSLQDSYTKVISDLEESVNLLPDSQLPKTRPTKAISYGLLARIYLSTFDFEKAAQAAERALDLYTDRLDFNQIDVNAALPFLPFGKEMVFYSETINTDFQFNREVFLDTLLLQDYGEGDLRLPAYFDQVGENRYYFSGKLTGNALPFGGLSVGELELIASEAYARIGNEEKSLNLLNGLLSRRIDSNVFVPVTIGGDKLIKRILLERRKELVGRGQRWTDLRRLNQEPGLQVVINRTVNGEKLTLEPKSDIYVFLIPDSEIMATGIEQNR